MRSSRFVFPDLFFQFFVVFFFFFFFLETVKTQSKTYVQDHGIKNLSACAEQSHNQTNVTLDERYKM